MRSKALTCAAAALALPLGALAQLPTVFVDCAGASVPVTGTVSDIERTSVAPNTILLAPGYQWAFNPIVSGTGVFGPSTLGTNRPLAAVLNQYFPGGQRVLYGAMRNGSGGHPIRLDYEPVATVVSGFNIALTMDHEILADGRCRAAIRKIERPAFVLGLDVNSGGLIVNIWTPPAPIVSEWHFDGNLMSVKEAMLPGAGASGSSKLRYLDDPAFGPLLGGTGSDTTYPSPATATGVTQTQSAFGMTTALSLPALGGAADTVYRTSPPRSNAAPTNANARRGIGLTLWPNTRDVWPDERLGQFTFVWDLLIPQASWNAARANGAAGNQCIPLVETSQNNNSAADQYLRVTGAAPGVAGVGCRVNESGAGVPPALINIAAIQPNQWFRLAIVVDLYGRKRSTIYVNGVSHGESGADWIYNACKSADPRWGDNTAVNPATNATVVPPTAWAGWGQFPSPWAFSGSPGGTGTATGAGTASTLSLFADFAGFGESVYVANMAFSDQPMSAAQVAALGGPNARGIVYLKAVPCAADFDGVNGLTVADIFAFLTAWFAGNPAADFDQMNGLTVADIFAFLTAWFAGCP